MFESGLVHFTMKLICYFANMFFFGDFAVPFPLFAMRNVLCYVVMRFESNEALFDLFTTHWVFFSVRVGHDGSLYQFDSYQSNAKTNRNVMVVVHPFVIANRQMSE